MAMHKNIPPACNHIVQSLEYADADERTTVSGLDDSDVGRIAAQLDDDTFWILADYSPVAWLPIGGSGSLVLNDLTDVSAGSPVTGEHLEWNGAAWVPTALEPSAVSVTHSIFNLPVEPGASDFVPFDTLEFKSSAVMHDATVSDSGTATGTQTSTTLQDTSKSWTTDEFVGYTVQIMSGTGVGEWRQIISNTSDTLTVAAWGTTPVAASSTYDITELSTRIVAPVDGYYEVKLHASIDFNAGILGAYIYVNGAFVAVHYAHQSQSIELNVGLFRLLELSADDYVEMKVYNGDSVSRNLFAGSARLVLQMNRIS